MKVFVLLGVVEQEGSTIIDVYLSREKADEVATAAAQYNATRPLYPTWDDPSTFDDPTGEQFAAAIDVWTANAPNPALVWYDRFRVLEKDVIE